MITIIGFPCSGTNFLHRMLAHYIDGPGMPVWDGMGMHGETQKIHWAYQREEFGEPDVYIVRDPRDCALSGLEYVRQLTGEPIPLMQFLEVHFSGLWSLWPAGWRDHTRYWCVQDIPLVRYEDLCWDRQSVLLRLVEQLNLDLDRDCISHAVEQSYRIGKRNDGRWKKELPLEANQWIAAKCGEWMEELGYT